MLDKIPAGKKVVYLAPAGKARCACPSFVHLKLAIEALFPGAI